MNPSREHPSTYFVQDRANQEELARLQIQDRMATEAMGGVLSEQPDPAIFQRVLDVACGPGGWLIEVAKTYPSIPMLVGVDVSSKFVEYAKAQAEAEGVSDRVQFRSMDVLRMLEFPSDYFDLVNQRLGGSFLRTWDWPKILQEMRRVALPGAVIRITESDSSETNSPALTRLLQILIEVLHQSGQTFTQGKYGPASELTHLLGLGLQNVQARPHTLEYRGALADGQPYYENTKHVFRTLVPYFRKWTRLPEDYEAIYQQALSEMQQPDCMTTWRLLTVWGNKPV
jgi:ubiquinone/menaquinone biosynthesis C-methylase UbiE